MTAAEIHSLVRDQIAGRWNETNGHRVDLKKSIITPAKTKLIHRLVQKGKTKEEIIDVWIVLEEEPQKKDGYKIVFDEKSRMFGLASVGFPSDPHPCLDGFYGDFWTAFKGM